MEQVLLKEAQQNKNYLVTLRRAFHQSPELANQEYMTAIRIEQELDKLNISHKRVGETGVLGVLTADGPKPSSGIVALRADIDALPIQEETGTTYASKTDGVMHACGHDAHTACLLGAAKLLRKHSGEWSGEVRFLFQPAEETGGGAKDFIDAGALQNVERVFSLHVAPDLPVGTVGIKPGLNNAAVDHFRIMIHGRAAHVSTPQLGADALYAASQLVVAIQGIVARRTSPVEPVVLGVGKLQAGTTYNAVAEYAALEGTTRTISRRVCLEMQERIDEAARHIASISGAEANVIWTDVCSALVNEPCVCQEAAEVGAALGLKVIDQRPLSLGGDNFAEYLRVVPGCYAYLGTANGKLPATHFGVHNGHFDLDEEALPYGSALYTACALKWLKNSH